MSAALIFCTRARILRDKNLYYLFPFVAQTRWQTFEDGGQTRTHLQVGQGWGAFGGVRHNVAPFGLAHGNFSKVLHAACMAGFKVIISRMIVIQLEISHIVRGIYRCH